MQSLRGFTLIEVLLATVLLAAGLALAFTTLRAATATAQRGEAMAQRNERMRAVAGFLRARLVAVKPLAFSIDQDTGLPLRFIGEPGRMRFVADLPAYLGHGGPYVHEVYASPGQGAASGPEGEVDLLLGLSVWQPLDVADAAEADPPEALARGLQSVRFRYRALDAEGRPGEWEEQWRARERLPMQVEIAIRDGEGREWPRLVVALPLAGTITSAFGEAL